MSDSLPATPTLLSVVAAPPRRGADRPAGDDRVADERFATELGSAAAEPRASDTPAVTDTRPGTDSSADDKATGAVDERAEAVGTSEAAQSETKTDGESDPLEGSETVEADATLAEALLAAPILVEQATVSIDTTQVATVDAAEIVQADPTLNLGDETSADEAFASRASAAGADVEATVDPQAPQAVADPEAITERSDTQPVSPDGEKAEFKVGSAGVATDGEGPGPESATAGLAAVEAIESGGDAEQPANDDDADGGDAEAAKPRELASTAPASDGAAVSANPTGSAQDGSPRDAPSPATNMTDANPSSAGASAADASREAASLGKPDAAATQEATDSPGRIDPGRFVSRVAKAFDIAQQRGGGPIEMRLSPPELGALQVRIELRDGVLTAAMETESPAARNALLDNLPALRDRLAEQQIRIEKFDVDVRDERGAQDGWRPDGERSSSGAEERGDREPRGGYDRSQQEDDEAIVRERLISALSPLALGSGRIDVTA